jgi:hypothetical protein
VVLSSERIVVAPFGVLQIQGHVLHVTERFGALSSSNVPRWTFYGSRAT